MKERRPRKIAAALASCILPAISLPAHADPVTDPVGWELITIHGNSHNLVAQRVHPLIVARGATTAVSGADVTDSAVDFDSVMTAGIPYVFECSAAPHAVVDVVSHAGHTLTLASGGFVSVGDSYRVRPLQKLSEILSPVLYPDFNPTEDFDPDTGDLILIPRAGGGYNPYYYSVFPGFEGYFNAGTGVAEDPFVRYTDSLLVLRRGLAFEIILTGEIKVTDTSIPLLRRFNSIGSITPASTFSSSGLEGTLNAGGSGSADIVWSQDETTGAFLRYFYSDGTGGLTTGWRLIGDGDVDHGADYLATGLIIRRRGVLPHAVLINGLPIF